MPITPADISIIIPAYNEEEAIGTLLKALRTSFPEAEMIVVNDGSTDNTAGKAGIPGVHMITHPFKRGYGAALKTGTQASSRSYVLFCDGDGQHSIEDVQRLISAVEDNDMVVGARGKDSYHPWIRRPGKWILRRFANFLAGQQIPDLNSGLRIFKREILMRYLHLMPDGFSFSTTSTFAILKSNCSYRYVPITVEKRIGKSTVSQFRHGPQTLMLMIRLAVLFEPLKVFLSVSVLLFFLTFTSVCIDLLLYRRGGIGDTTVMLFIAGVIVFMSGLLCDQVSAIRREKHE